MIHAHTVVRWLPCECESKLIEANFGSASVTEIVSESQGVVGSFYVIYAFATPFFSLVFLAFCTWHSFARFICTQISIYWISSVCCSLFSLSLCLICLLHRSFRDYFRCWKISAARVPKRIDPKTCSFATNKDGRRLHDLFNHLNIGQKT